MYNTWSSGFLNPYKLFCARKLSVTENTLLTISGAFS